MGSGFTITASSIAVASTGRTRQHPIPSTKLYSKYRLQYETTTPGNRGDKEITIMTHIDLYRSLLVNVNIVRMTITDHSRSLQLRHKQLFALAGKQLSNNGIFRKPFPSRLKILAASKNHMRFVRTKYRS